VNGDEQGEETRKIEEGLGKEKRVILMVPLSEILRKIIKRRSDEENIKQGIDDIGTDNVGNADRAFNDCVGRLRASTSGDNSGHNGG
jgi:hypothetical protein